MLQDGWFVFDIVFFFYHKGETSSGKSSIINGILGEKILPTGITATTTRVCRIKYAKELLVSARDQNDKKDIKRISVKSTKQMADEVKNMASTDNSKISFVDIFMPVRFQQVKGKIFACLTYHCIGQPILEPFLCKKNFNCKWLISYLYRGIE